MTFPPSKLVGHPRPYITKTKQQQHSHTCMTESSSSSWNVQSSNNFRVSHGTSDWTSSTNRVAVANSKRVNRYRLLGTGSSGLLPRFVSSCPGGVFLFRITQTHSVEGNKYWFGCGFIHQPNLDTGWGHLQYAVRAMEGTCNLPLLALSFGWHVNHYTVTRL